MSLMLNQQHHKIRDRYYIDINVINGTQVLEPAEGTYFILSQCSELTSDTLQAKGCYAAMISQGTVSGQALSIYMPGVHRNNSKITAVDPMQHGCLSYIDGCSNSNLIDPDRNGDPCLNYLYFPHGIDQTFHIHPSVRIGYVIHGEGHADFYDTDGNITSKVLKSGDTFVLDRFCQHRFRTTRLTMSILVFHPDSEDGPRDEHNPMKTRTYLR